MPHSFPRVSALCAGPTLFCLLAGCGAGRGDVGVGAAFRSAVCRGLPCSQHRACVSARGWVSSRCGLAPCDAQWPNPTGPYKGLEGILTGNEFFGNSIMCMTMDATVRVLRTMTRTHTRACTASATLGRLMHAVPHVSRALCRCCARRRTWRGWLAHSRLRPPRCGGKATHYPAPANARVSVVLSTP
jgi:hypothetical protein